MNQGASQLLTALVLGAVALGAMVLLLVPDYRQGKIVESNRAYMPSVHVDNRAAPLAEAWPDPTPEADELLDVPADGAVPSEMDGGAP
jgi:hypothetical protein